MYKMTKKELIKKLQRWKLVMDWEDIAPKLIEMLKREIIHPSQVEKMLKEAGAL